MSQIPRTRSRNGNSGSNEANFTTEERVHHHNASNAGGYLTEQEYFEACDKFHGTFALRNQRQLSPDDCSLIQATVDGAKVPSNETERSRYRITLEYVYDPADKPENASFSALETFLDPSLSSFDKHNQLEILNTLKPVLHSVLSHLVNASQTYIDEDAKGRPVPKPRKLSNSAPKPLPEKIADSIVTAVKSEEFDAKTVQDVMEVNLGDISEKIVDRNEETLSVNPRNNSENGKKLHLTAVQIDASNPKIDSWKVPPLEINSAEPGVTPAVKVPTPDSLLPEYSLARCANNENLENVLVATQILGENSMAQKATALPDVVDEANIIEVKGKAINDDASGFKVPQNVGLEVSLEVRTLVNSDTLTNQGKEINAEITPVRVSVNESVSKNEINVSIQEASEGHEGKMEAGIDSQAEANDIGGEVTLEPHSFHEEDEDHLTPIKNPSDSVSLRSVITDASIFSNESVIIKGEQNLTIPIGALKSPIKSSESHDDIPFVPVVIEKEAEQLELEPFSSGKCPLTIAGEENLLTLNGVSISHRNSNEINVVAETVISSNAGEFGLQFGLEVSEFIDEREGTKTSTNDVVAGIDTIVEKSKNSAPPDVIGSMSASRKDAAIEPIQVSVSVKQFSETNSSVVEVACKISQRNSSLDGSLKSASDGMSKLITAITDPVSNEITVKENSLQSALETEAVNKIILSKDKSMPVDVGVIQESVLLSADDFDKTFVQVTVMENETSAHKYTIDSPELEEAYDVIAVDTLKEIPSEVTKIGLKNDKCSTSNPKLPCKRSKSSVNSSSFQIKQHADIKSLPSCHITCEIDLCIQWPKDKSLDESDEIQLQIQIPNEELEDLMNGKFFNVSTTIGSAHEEEHGNKKKAEDDQNASCSILHGYALKKCPVWYNMSLVKDLETLENWCINLSSDFVQDSLPIETNGSNSVILQSQKGSANKGVLLKSWLTKHTMHMGTVHSAHFTTQKFKEQFYCKQLTSSLISGDSGRYRHGTLLSELPRQKESNYQGSPGIQPTPIRHNVEVFAVSPRTEIVVEQTATGLMPTNKLTELKVDRLQDANFINRRQKYTSTASIAIRDHCNQHFEVHQFEETPTHATNPPLKAFPENWPSLKIQLKRSIRLTEFSEFLCRLIVFCFVLVFLWAKKKINHFGVFVLSTLEFLFGRGKRTDVVIEKSTNNNEHCISQGKRKSRAGRLSRRTRELVQTGLMLDGRSGESTRQEGLHCPSYMLTRTVLEVPITSPHSVTTKESENAVRLCRQAQEDVHAFRVNLSTYKTTMPVVVPRMKPQPAPLPIYSSILKNSAGIQTNPCAEPVSKNRKINYSEPIEQGKNQLDLEVRAKTGENSVNLALWQMRVSGDDHATIRSVSKDSRNEESFEAVLNSTKTKPERGHTSSCTVECLVETEPNEVGIQQHLITFVDIDATPVLERVRCQDNGCIKSPILRTGRDLAPIHTPGYRLIAGKEVRSDNSLSGISSDLLQTDDFTADYFGHRYCCGQSKRCKTESEFSEMTICPNYAYMPMPVDNWSIKHQELAIEKTYTDSHC